MKKEYINCPRIAKIIEFFHSVLERMIDKEMECDYNKWNIKCSSDTIAFV